MRQTLERTLNFIMELAAIAADDNGTRRILGFDGGMGGSGAFWEEFLRSLVSRGLSGVRLVISDAHEGLKNAVAKMLPGTSWRRCRVRCKPAGAAQQRD